MSKVALLVSDKKYIRADINGGVQLCTQEYIRYIQSAGYEVKEFHVAPSISIVKRIKIKLGVDTYDHYNIDPYKAALIQTINESGIKLVFFNQLNLAVWATELKKHVAADVKFVGLSHGNESADYLNDITKPGKTTFLQTWKLGKLLVKENSLFASALNGVIVLSELEVAINHWIGADAILYLPRLLKPNFIQWQPTSPTAGFVGTLDHLPNLLGIQYLAEELQRSGFNYQLELIGGPALTGERLASQYSFIKYVGPVSDAQLVEQVKTWSVFLNPVFWYARGASTKLAQAINWGLPCLTTPAGRRGYHLNNEAIVTSDNTPKTFAKAVINALVDNTQLSALKTASENNAEQFDMKPYIDQLTNFLNRIAATED
jgi:hypothetical protein